MSEFATARLPEGVDVIAPDGSEIREMLALDGGSMVHCTLPPGATTIAVRHRTVEEIWYVVSGEGEIWRRQGDREEVTSLGAGACLTIPLGTAFQFRATGPDPLALVLATMPPWPGAGEAVLVADGRWAPSLRTARLRSTDAP